MDQLISPEELYREIQGPIRPTVVDVRSAEAYAEAHIPHAMHIPRDEIEDSLHQIPRDMPVVTY